MRVKIISWAVVLSLIASISCLINAATKQAIVHNMTSYNLRASELRTFGVTIHKTNVEFPPNKVTTVDLGAYDFKWMVLAGMLGNIYVSHIMKIEERTFGTRNWYIFAEEPTTRVANPALPGTYTDVSSNYVRFCVVVTPSGIHKGGIYFSGWFNKLTGQPLSVEDIEQFPLNIFSHK